MRNFILLLLLVFFSSCKTQKQHAKSEEDYYVEAYKSTVFKACFNESTGKDFEKFIIGHNDLGGYTDVAVLLHATYQRAAEKGRIFSLTIKSVSYPDADNKMPGYRDCFRYAMSREIDSIARVEYKKSKE